MPIFKVLQKVKKMTSQTTMINTVLVLKAVFSYHMILDTEVSHATVLFNAIKKVVSGKESVLCERRKLKEERPPEEDKVHI